MDTQSIDIFTQARRIDPTLKLAPKHHAEMARRQIHPVAFSRETLFASMAAGKPVVFTDVPVPVKGEQELGRRQAVFQSLRSGFRKRQTFRVRQGRDGERRQSLRVDELLRRWSGDRGLVNITDLHIRGSKLFRSIDCSALSDFNLLAGARDPVGAEEMLTMVVSSAGVFTDSHSDVPDGSNHCFVGKKLWLVWDTFEGIARNLEDVERSGTDRDQAAFKHLGVSCRPRLTMVRRRRRPDPVPAGPFHPQGDHARGLYRHRQFLRHAPELLAHAAALDRAHPAMGAQCPA